MLFNSFEFAIFLPFTFIIYWFVLNRRLSFQNLFLVAASYLFYGWWDWHFLGLIAITSAVDYVLALQIYACNQKVKRKLLFGMSLAMNLGVLGFFKYFNFFTDNLSDLYSIFGVTLHLETLKIILPLGLSFYTFQELSYTIDVYKNRHEPTKDIVAFFAFVSFFPQLVAGPIGRANKLLPQFTRTRQFDYQFASEGLKLVLWGLFKKVVIADSCAESVGYIFSNYATLNGNTLLLGAVYFAFQIYGDFSGYSDIARGIARLFGIDLMKNFAFPYFSENFTEFWKRWHISLSTWFRDYVYIPLGGNRCTEFRHYMNIMIAFLLSGIWHGANWTFLFWGALNGLYLVTFLFFENIRYAHKPRTSLSFLTGIRPFMRIGFTFFLTTIAWIFFRAENMHIALEYIRRIFTLSFFSRGLFAYERVLYANFDALPLRPLWIILFLLCVEWRQRDQDHPLHFVKMPIMGRWIVYVMLTLWITESFVRPQTFIYFQF